MIMHDLSPSIHALVIEQAAMHALVIEQCHTPMGSLDPAGPSQFGPDSQQPSSNGFGGFPLPSSSSPFFDAQQTSMADIFPSQSAALLQPATSQAPSNSISLWPSASGTASGSLPHQFSDQDRMLQVCTYDIVNAHP